jgi:septum formation protein
MTQSIILASGSASRRALLKGAGVSAETINPYLDESAAKTAMRGEGMSIRDQAMRLAELKALKISAQESGLIIGGDQMLALGDRAFDKPVDLAGARRHLEALSGQTHILETAIVIAENGEIVWKHLARPKLTMRELSDDFMSLYLEEVGEDVLSTVGGYKLELMGSQLFTAIEGDYFSILGLPLLPLLDYLRTRGILAT